MTLLCYLHLMNKKISSKSWINWSKAPDQRGWIHNSTPHHSKSHNPSTTWSCFLAQTFLEWSWVCSLRLPWTVFYALISCWQALPCPSWYLWSPRTFLWDADRRYPISNKQAGSLQMGPRWWHYLSSGMEPGEGLLERVGTRLGWPNVQWRAWPRPERWSHAGSELPAQDRLDWVGTSAATRVLNISCGSGMNAWQEVG